jgi:hypothetical protein
MGILARTVVCDFDDLVTGLILEYERILEWSLRAWVKVHTPSAHKCWAFSFFKELNIFNFGYIYIKTINIYST